MKTQILLHYIARVAFLGALFALTLTFIELSAHFFGFSIIGHLYSLGRLLDLATTLVMLAAAIWIHEIRDGLRESRN